MAYPTGVLSLTLQDVDRLAIQVKDQSNRNVAELNGTVTSSQIIGIYSALSGAKAKFNAAKNVTGLAQFAKDQKANQSLDIVAEFVSMVTAIDTCRTWIATNFPQDGNGYLLASKFDANGTAERTFNSAATVGLKTALTALIAEIA